MSLRSLAEDRGPFNIRHAMGMAVLALVVTMGLPAGPAAASNGDDDGRHIPPNRWEFEGKAPGPNIETANLKRRAPSPTGETGVLGDHMDQNRINSGEASFEEVFNHGKHLFSGHFNTLDGQGRPTMTSGGGPPVGGLPVGGRLLQRENKIRTSGPDSSSCWECHNLPRSGGGGDFNAVMFSGLHGKALAFNTDPTVAPTDTSAHNQRAGPSVFGNGALEMLAREMTVELLAIRDTARAEAATAGTVRKELVSKGSKFGFITARADGTIDGSEIVGVDWDLVVKPHTHKGTGVSLRGFSTGGSFLHLGMTSVERFGETNLDGDDVTIELSIGDVTALTVWMAAIPVPGRVLPKDKDQRAAVVRGEELFTQINCASCHTPAMYLDNPVFTEPNPYNGTGLLKVADVPQPFSFDITRQGPGPRPEQTKDGRAIIRAFTDLKRHNITDVSGRFSEERVPGGSLLGLSGTPANVGAVPGVLPASVFVPAPPAPLAVNVFLTEKLWDAGSTAPYGHRGDLTTFTEAIAAHGGEAAGSRTAFGLLSASDKACVIDFLKSLQVVPQGASLITDEGDSIR